MFLRKKRLEETSLEEITGPDSESRRPPVEMGTRDRYLEATADRMILRLAVSKLSRGLRKALLLQDVHSYEHKAVAAMGWAPGTLKSQLPKARLRVREVLNKFFKRYRCNGNRSDMGSAGKAFGGPPAQNDKLPSTGEPKSKPDDAPRKRERAIPSWCKPLDDEAASPSE